MKYILEGSNKDGENLEMPIWIDDNANLEDINVIFEKTGDAIAISELLMLIEIIKQFHITEEN